MHMGLVSKLLGGEPSPRRHASLHGASYLDLGEIEGTDPAPEASVWIKIAEVNKLDDLKEFAHHVYDGHVLVLDIRKIATDEILLRRFTNEVRKIATDVRGDVAGIAEHLVVVTPGGVRVDKQKIRVAPVR